MLVLYGGFAFIVTALLLEKPERLQLVIKFLRFLALMLVPLAPIIVIMTNAAANAEGEVTQWSLMQKSEPPPFIFPRPRCWSFWLQTSGPSVVRSSDCRHGRRRQPQSRCNARYHFHADFRLASWRKAREFAVVAAIGAALLGLAYVTDLSIPTARETRAISAEQLVENVDSIFGARDNQDLSGTKEWRLHWWETIIDYTINGPYFWTGKGFGVDLGADDNVIPITFV